jgi:hypothetical protein
MGQLYPSIHVFKDEMVPIHCFMKGMELSLVWLRGSKWWDMDPYLLLAPSSLCANPTRKIVLLARALMLPTAASWRCKNQSPRLRVYVVAKLEQIRGGAVAL